MHPGAAFPELDPPPHHQLFHLVPHTESTNIRNGPQVLHGTPSYLSCCRSLEGRAKGLSWLSLLFCLQQWYRSARATSTKTAENTPASTGPTPSRSRTKRLRRCLRHSSGFQTTYSDSCSDTDLHLMCVTYFNLKIIIKRIFKRLGNQRVKILEMPRGKM